MAWRPLLQVDAFTTTPCTGNPAAVIPDADDLDPVVMQRIAREMNLSETAFILKSSVADWRLRWWTPTVEVPLCGHATVAACHALVELGRVEVPGSYTIETASGVLGVELLPSQNAPCEVWLEIPIPDFEPFNISSAVLADALNIDKDALWPEILPARGGEYAYLAVRQVTDLLAMRPDFRALELLSSSHNVSGWVIYTLSGIELMSAAHVRFFGPALGINEDPVTGSAQGPLGALLAINRFVEPAKGRTIRYQAEQGDAMGRPGRVHVEVELDGEGVPVRTRIGGVGVTVVRGEVRI